MASREAVATLDLEKSIPSSKRAVLQRLAGSIERAPRFRRASMLACAGRARAGLANVTGAGAERVLANLARSAADDEAWLRSVEAFTALQRGDSSTARRSRIAALILFAPDQGNGRGG